MGLTGIIGAVALTWYLVGGEALGNITSATRDASAGASIKARGEAKKYRDEQYERYNVK